MVLDHRAQEFAIFLRFGQVFGLRAQIFADFLRFE